MFGMSGNVRIFDSYKKHQHLSEYSDQDLLDALQNIETTPTQILSCICAEILRRQLSNKQIKDS